jgi:hypothetical protein
VLYSDAFHFCKQVLYCIEFKICIALVLPAENVLIVFGLRFSRCAPRNRCSMLEPRTSSISSTHLFLRMRASVVSVRVAWSRAGRLSMLWGKMVLCTSVHGRFPNHLVISCSNRLVDASRERGCKCPLTELSASSTKQWAFRPSMY